MTENKVLHVEENGIEFFTVVATGECAVSGRSLAKMCGVPETTVRRWLNHLRHESTPEWLKSLQSIDLHLRHEIKKRGKRIKPISAKAAARFIGLVAKNLKTTEAIASLDAFAEIGLNSFIQTKTGWLPERYTAAPQQHSLLNRILDNPDPWERLYHPNLCKQAFAWFGASFYWDYCYQWMTPEERCKVDSLNPPINGRRARKIHQYLEPEIRERLKPQIANLALLLEATTDKQQFKALYRNLYGRGKQLELFR